MNKILKLSAIALLSMTTSLMAQKSFQGTSVALTASVVGAEAKGTVTSSDASSNSDSGSVGRVGAFAGIDAAYTVGAGTNGFFGFGATYIPFKAELATATGGKSGQDGASTNSGKAEIKDYYTLYIQPGYAINNTSAIYAKILYANAKLDVSGATSASKNLEGWGGGIGLKTFLDNFDKQNNIMSKLYIINSLYRYLYITKPISLYYSKNFRNIAIIKAQEFINERNHLKKFIHHKDYYQLFINYIKSKRYFIPPVKDVMEIHKNKLNYQCCKVC